MNFRPAAVPLITVDPYFSIWSVNDKLYEGVTHHWSGRRNPMTAALIIDSRLYMLMGEVYADGDRHSYGYHPNIEQKSVTVTPTRTIYEFENELVKVKLIFTTPLLLDNLKIMSRPVSYIEYDIEVIDGKEHEVSFWFDISSECCIDGYDAEVEFGRTKNSVYCGNSVQNVLSKSGDSVCVDWGYLHLACPEAKIIKGNTRINMNYKDGQPEEIDGKSKVFDEYPCIGIRKDTLQDVIVVAYDDVKSIEYFGDKRDGYYKKFYGSFDEMLSCAIEDYDEIKGLCECFDLSLMSEARKIGEKYEKITSLAYRQAIAAHKLIEDENGEMVFLSKECHSNGCIGTLDVTYPSIPLFLKFNPELVCAMLRPIIKFANSDKWEYEFAPHDVGRYPLANGQVYGYEHTEPEKILARQMPVEECGNMLLCVGAYIKMGEKRKFADDNKALLKKWADYLVREGYDPGNQLCTDDFAGHLAHNCNLSLKAILGIASYGKIFNDEVYMKKALELAKKWEKDAVGEQGTRLAFDLPDSWSIKYNIVWDKLLDINIFDKNVFDSEVALYKSKLNRYGVPLDRREDYTKLDWLVWTTVMNDDKEYHNMVFDSVCDFINETTDRVPMTDWYYTSIPRMKKFQNRTVLGGIFINLL